MGGSNLVYFASEAARGVRCNNREGRICDVGDLTDFGIGDANNNAEGGVRGHAEGNVRNVE